jgi:hypothetical protein
MLLQECQEIAYKCEANANSWMTTKIFEDYVTRLDRKLGAKDCKILLFR